jgi:hypothetical protein
MPDAWSAQTSWTEVCQRANGRADITASAGSMLACTAGRSPDALCVRGSGLARRFKISKATITADVRAILVTPQGPSRQRRQGV